MILDYRTYLSLYAIAGVAWLAAAFLIGNVSHRTSARYMFAVAGAATLIALVNYLDWLWS